MSVLDPTLYGAAVNRHLRADEERRRKIDADNERANLAAAIESGLRSAYYARSSVRPCRRRQVEAVSQNRNRRLNLTTKARPPDASSDLSVSNLINAAQVALTSQEMFTVSIWPVIRRQ